LAVHSHDACNAVSILSKPRGSAIRYVELLIGLVNLVFTTATLDLRDQTDHGDDILSARVLQVSPRALSGSKYLQVPADAKRFRLIQSTLGTAIYFPQYINFRPFTLHPPKSLLFRQSPFIKHIKITFCLPFAFMSSVISGIYTTCPQCPSVSVSVLLSMSFRFDLG
jgi:hypothetical protein